MEDPSTPSANDPVERPEVGGNWFILLGALPALLVLGVAAWLALCQPVPSPVRPPPPPPAPSSP